MENPVACSCLHLCSFSKSLREDEKKTSETTKGLLSSLVQLGRMRRRGRGEERSDGFPKLKNPI